MIYFIYNPNAGNKSNRYRQKLINTLQKIPNSILLLTEYPRHAEELINTIIPKHPEKIIAIGGDGTINEVGSILKGTNIPMGIIPLGSGNGLARHLKIPMNTEKALAIALQGNANYIDVLGWNKRAFFCTAGIGFDAYVASIFHAGNGRGLINYIKASFKAIRSFEPIEISIDSVKSQQYFSFTIANANQFGNDAYISPLSNLQDALFELVKIKNGNLWQKAQLGISLFSKRIHLHPLVDIIQAKSLKFSCKIGCFYHLDGESLQTESEVINIELLPEKLLVIHP